MYGAGTRSRTRDLLITNQLLYQLSYAGGRRPRAARGGRIIGFSGLSDKGSRFRLLRTRGQLAQQDLLFAVSLDDRTCATAWRKSHVDKIDGPVSHSRRNVSRQLE